MELTNTNLTRSWAELESEDFSTASVGIVLSLSLITYNITSCSDAEVYAEAGAVVVTDINLTAPCSAFY